jgi:hypothetical protein
MAGLVLGLLVRNPERVIDEPDAWLGKPSVWQLEFNRLVHESAGLARRDDSATIRRGHTAVRTRCDKWAVELIVDAVRKGDDARSLCGA